MKNFIAMLLLCIFFMAGCNSNTTADYRPPGYDNPMPHPGSFVPPWVDFKHRLGEIAEDKKNNKR